MNIYAADVTIKAVEHVNAADTSQTVPLFELPPGAYIIAFGGRVKTAFAGVTLPSICVGTSNNTDEVMMDQPVNQRGDFVPGGQPNKYFPCPVIDLSERVTTEAGRSILATFTSASGNFSSLTAGEVEFFLVYVD